MDFGDVIKGVRTNRYACFRRDGWGPGRSYIGLAESFCPMELPYFFMYTQSRHIMSWTPSQVDMLADDWVEVVDREFKLRCGHEVQV